MNPCRGHESMAHLEAKTMIGRLFNDPGWSVFHEQRNADILVMHDATRLVAAIEVESTPRNVRRNLERNTANGCGVVAVVALNRRNLPRIAAMAIQHATARPGAGIMVFAHDARGLQSMRRWLVAIARFKQDKTENCPSRTRIKAHPIPPRPSGNPFANQQPKEKKP